MSQSQGFGPKVEDCGRCGLVVDPPSEGLVLYVHPDQESTARIVVHAICIADEAGEGTVVRVSPYAFRAA